MKSKRHYNTYFPEIGDNWYFYHDALSQMTAGDCREWMMENSIWEHWLRPVGGTELTWEDGDDYVITEGRDKWRDAYPPGNSPTYMPWDVALNKDLHDCVKRHVLLTGDLENDDFRKFSLATPKEGTRAYIRCLEGSPLPHRINRDIRFFVDTALSIYESKGAIVNGLGNGNYRSGT